MVARFCRNKFPSDNSQYPQIVFTHSCSPDGTISTKVNTLNKCLSCFGFFKVFGLFTKYTNSRVTGCRIEDLRLLVSSCSSTWITDWDSFFRSLFKVKILRHFLWYEIRGISPSFKVFAILRIPSWLRITAPFKSVFHDSRSLRETKSPVSSLQWIIHSSTRWRLFSSALPENFVSLLRRWNVDSRCNIWYYPGFINTYHWVHAHLERQWVYINCCFNYFQISVKMLVCSIKGKI